MRNHANRTVGVIGLVDRMRMDDLHRDEQSKNHYSQQRYQLTSATAVELQAWSHEQAGTTLYFGELDAPFP